MSNNNIPSEHSLATSERLPRNDARDLASTAIIDYGIDNVDASSETLDRLHAAYRNLEVNELAGRLIDQTYLGKTVRERMSGAEQVDYLGRIIEALDGLAGIGNIEQQLNGCLHEIVFRTREVLFTEGLDDSILLADTSFGRDAMLLYISVEHALSGDIDTAASVIAEMKSKNLAEFLRKKLTEAHKYTSAESAVAEDVSERNLAAIAGNDVARSRERASGLQFEVIVGMQLKAALGLFSGKVNGRVLSAREIPTSGGKNPDLIDDRRDMTYFSNRKYIESEMLGIPDNLFLASPISGSLEVGSDTGHNAYGRVTLHLNEKMGTTYTLGDSMDVVRGTETKRVTRSDAEAAVIFNEEHTQSGNNKILAYIEAQIPGVFADKEDVRFVSIYHQYNAMRPQSDEETQETIRLVHEVIARGVPVCLDFEETSRAMRPYIDSDNDESLIAQFRQKFGIDESQAHMFTVHLINPKQLGEKSMDDRIKKLNQVEGVAAVVDGVTYPGGV